MSQLSDAEPFEMETRRMKPPRAATLFLGAVLGCGGGKATPAGPAEPADDCEPGRCLVRLLPRSEQAEFDRLKAQAAAKR